MVRTIDKKVEDGPSFWLLIWPLLLIMRQTVMLRQRADASNYTAVDGFAVLDIGIMGICILVIMSNFRNIPWEKILNSSFFWWIFYYIFACFSIFWNIEGTSDLFIIYRAVSMLVMSLYIFFIMSKFQTREKAFKSLFKYILIIMLLGMFPHIKRGSLHTNSYSVSAAVLVIMSMAAMKYKLLFFKEIKWYLILGFIALVLGTSSASNVAFICGVAFLLSLSKKSFSFMKFFLLIIAIYTVYELFLPYLIEIVFPGKTAAGITSGTGRFKMWSMYYEAWKESPMLGYGFAVGERAGAMLGYIYTLSAHNGFISVLINTGLIGCFLWGLYFLGFLINLTNSVFKGDKYGTTIAATMVVIIVNNMSVPIIGANWSTLATVALLLISFFVIFVKNQKKEI